MAEAIWIEITKVRGSAPRDAGTVMKITATDTNGTIGGGALEYRAIATARKILDANAPEQTETIPLGPSLGQCCGGVVTLNYSYAPKGFVALDQFHVHQLKPNPSHPKFLWVWGAGHVGREVIAQSHPQAFNITWVDSTADRFPKRNYKHVTITPAADMPRLAARAPTYAHHLIFTYSHEIDLGLCAALLKRGAASIGLIGSETKWARFSKRLREMGLDPSPITCPIGDKSLGKAPHAIAQGTVQSLMASK
ncbi:xanthine dehydrogenase accessory protein XdhC [Sulfitobacter donghicola]|uniref:Xanthine dehydrogenase accessory protein XdhC n=1 Tax=Sulfitobacter donghicola DSW-25 = KCTC 12864 = JCM 14565 TaxID=1300350 RepID=A0A073IHH0_9RHOB|nr:xanthine dehydrogenase accessory protein XdhC [Sulfitobacter donghicola]KEJ88990.1 xanthine dehydrogenase accessory protein XdhC [Sulfitobacter donghicola DSW-25 = KCTC 12864 = JCM 14565]KIN67458.1 Xanthine dehydrogenase accessory protein XdhC [Sulfitobacter donghicola DSW-25 = KCTC 12864 = JCM 14565]